MTEDGCREVVVVLRCGWDLACGGPDLNLLRPGEATARGTVGGGRGWTGDGSFGGRTFENRHARLVVVVKFSDHSQSLTKCV
jgi:hypothetical protein